jgi:hypothetical protein
MVHTGDLSPDGALDGALDGTDEQDDIRIKFAPGPYGALVLVPGTG